MKKLHGEEEAHKITAFVEWKAQRHRKCLALEDWIEQQLEALEGWKEMVHERRSSGDSSRNEGGQDEFAIDAM